MSINSSDLLNKEYKTYADAVSAILEKRDLSQIWLVKQIQRENQRIKSLQQQMSRWLRESATISEGYQHRINNALDVFIRRESDGKWVILQKNQSDPIEEQGIFQIFEQKIDKIGEKDLNYLPSLVRVRNKLNKKIRMMTESKEFA
ncbi:hypothetical protein [Rhodohalobacter sulfatireducens]|uniref:DUF2383 domain-containing protein n=1 Tax=Rhodohalobacter sulfatireducens TaxID=2911366 RepID=A0ABS9KI88_9BACT|nr:hypothetical protein [Rhodohalobacter sulfatireducens]MCG2590568.1 hypothetical protein [Rhodohalobacter sulfatireducens]